MSVEVHIEWKGLTYLVGHLHLIERSKAIAFEYDKEWLERDDSFSIDPSALPLHKGVQHSANLFGAIQDCGPDRWGKALIERAVRKKVLSQKPYRDIDYVLALDDEARIGALRFKGTSGGPFLAPSKGIGVRQAER